MPVPGRNSNLASGPAELVVDTTVNPPVATRVRGDFLLKQDNEGSCARGSRNPKNILCGGNDYGLVDVPGIDPQDVVRDAGAGVYQSPDGGDTWESTMLRGHVLDSPSAGLLKNYTAFADVTVRSGAAGIAYYTGIAFKSKNNTSIAYVATFLELNSREDNRTPFTYLYTVKLDSVPENIPGSSPPIATAFIDKPWSVVLPPQGGATCTINVPRTDGTTITQRIPDSPLIVGYSVFLGLEKHPDLRLTAEMIVRVTNCGRNVSKPKLVGLGHRLNGMSLAASPVPGSKRVVGVWRRFANQFVTDAMFAVVSDDGGVNWSAPQQIASICPFQQASTGFSARVNTFSSVAIDHKGRIAVAWSDRGRDQTNPSRPCLDTGQSRIVISTSMNGATWSAPQVVDPGTGLGHQITPSLTYGGGTLLLLWKDLRETAAQYFDEFIWEFPLLRAAAGQFDPPPPGAVPGPPFYHNTIEFYSKMANVDNGIQWGPSVRVSQYKFGTSPGETVPTQKQWEIINLKLFARGTKVFDSDYPDGAGPPLLPPDKSQKRSRWTPDTGQNGQPTFYGVWTSNRDVHRVSQHTDPTGTEPIPYTPPALTGTSWVDPTQTRPACQPGVADFTKTMDQNLYGTRISRGLYAFSPGNNKQVTGFQRAFVVTARNDSPVTKSYLMSIPSAFQTVPGGFVSFSQFAPFGGANATRVVTVAPKSTASRTVFIIPDTNPGTNLDPRQLVRVDVTEIVPGGGTGATSSVYLNSDPTAPEIEAPEIEAPEIEAEEVYTPEIEAAIITAHTPGAPEIEAPEIEATSGAAPEIEAPEIEAKSFQSPEIEATGIGAPEIEAPEIEAPEIEANAITDVSWPLTNKGNTTAGYIIRPLVGGDRTGFHFQLVGSRTVLIATAKDCQPAFAKMSKVALNLRDANRLVDAAAVITPEELANATVWIAPGETMLITLRVRGAVTFDPFQNPTVLTVTQQAVDTRLLPPDGSPVDAPTFTRSASPNIFFVQQPQDITSGSAFDPPVQVRVQDDSGAVLPGVTVNLSLITPPGSTATLFGVTTAVTSTDGIATFDPTGVTGGGTFALRASVPGASVSPGDSVSFDVSGGGATFVVTNTADEGAGSLRAALLNADENGPGIDTIAFDISGGSPPFTISLLSPLSPIDSTVVIDGYTQPGSAPGAPTIELNGLEAGLGASGLTIAGNGSTVRGLVINRFSGPGITITSSGSSIRGNFIGTDLSGQTARPNAQGILIGNTATGNTIGGDVAADRNIIGGNSEFGVMIEGSGNIVRGNVIGRDASAPIGVANGTPGAPNSAGIMLLGGASNNYIGGIGGRATFVPNIIGQNNGRGISLSNGGIAGVGPAGTGNGIGFNNILDNTGLGIDLGHDGVTANDGSDADTGPNNFQNTPVISSAVDNGDVTVVDGQLSSLPLTLFRVSLYHNVACDPSGSGEGQTYIEHFSVFTNSDGTATFTRNVPRLTVGTFITAIASTLTDDEISPGELDSSEFSPCRDIIGPAAPPPLLFGVNSSDDGLSVLNPATGASVFIGALGSGGEFQTPVAAAARPSDDMLYAWNNSSSLGDTGELVAIDSCTGGGTRVDPATPGQGAGGGLAFAPSGLLFGTGSGGDPLFRINPETGVRTPIAGAPGLPITVAGLAFNSAGTLYAVPIDGSQLHTINTTTGVITPVAPLTLAGGAPADVAPVGSIVFSPAGTLIGSSFGATSQLFDIDPATGIVSNFRTVTGTGGLPQGMDFALECPASLTIRTKTLPVGLQGFAYRATVRAVAGQPSYGWSVTSGSLPPGLSLDAATGVISGTPTVPGSFTFTVAVTDTSEPTPATATKSLTIVIQPLGAP